MWSPTGQKALPRCPLNTELVSAASDPFSEFGQVRTGPSSGRRAVRWCQPRLPAATDRPPTPRGTARRSDTPRPAPLYGDARADSQTSPALPGPLRPPPQGRTPPLPRPAPLPYLPRISWRRTGTQSASHLTPMCNEPYACTERNGLRTSFTA